jgi:hypothetical protein
MGVLLHEPTVVMNTAPDAAAPGPLRPAPSDPAPSAPASASPPTCWPASPPRPAAWTATASGCWSRADAAPTTPMSSTTCSPTCRTSWNPATCWS